MAESTEAKVTKVGFVPKTEHSAGQISGKQWFLRGLASKSSRSHRFLEGGVVTHFVPKNGTESV